MAGFEPVEVPLVERVWQVDAVADAARAPFDIVLLTSASAVDVFGTAVPRGLPGARYAVVGPATARRLVEFGWSPDVIPERATAADLVAALGDLGGRRVLYPRADLASPGAAHLLRQGGAAVVEVVAYVNTAPLGHRRALLEVLPVEATTLLSGSAAERLLHAVAPDALPALGKIVVIGPSTRQAVERGGLRVDAQAEPHTVAGIVDALLRVFA